MKNIQIRAFLIYFQLWQHTHNTRKNLEDLNKRIMYIILVCVIVLSSVESRKVVDLTHTFDGEAPNYPLEHLGVKNLVYYNMTTVLGQYFDDMWLEIRKMEYYEHQGTHIDAPLHFAKGRQSLEQIPPERLYGPGVVIDVKDKVKVNPNYAVTVDDILDHEREHGKIPPNAIVNMNSGWASKYPNALHVFGTDNLTDTTSFNFPGWSPDACQMLLQERQINVLGVDTPSTDPAQPPVYPCHMYLQPNNVPLMEYVANLDSIPVRNTTIVLGAMKVRDGTGGPTRVFAFIDDEEDDENTNSVGVISPCVCVISIMFCSLYM